VLLGRFLGYPERSPGNAVDGAGDRRSGLGETRPPRSGARCGDRHAAAAHAGHGCAGSGGRNGGGPTRLLELPLSCTPTQSAASHAARIFVSGVAPETSRSGRVPTASPITAGSGHIRTHGCLRTAEPRARTKNGHGRNERPDDEERGEGILFLFFSRLSFLFRFLFLFSFFLVLFARLYFCTFSFANIPFRLELSFVSLFDADYLCVNAFLSSL